MYNLNNDRADDYLIIPNTIIEKIPYILKQSAFEDQSFYKLQIFNMYMRSHINIPDLLLRA